MAQGRGWRLETRPFADPRYLATFYVDAAGNETFGAISLATDAIVLDVVADPIERHVSVFQDGNQVLDLFGVEADGMRIGEGWSILPGATPVCSPILDRMSAPG